MAMERRGFLKTTFAGGLAAGGAACATSSERTASDARLSDAELERTLRRLDRTLAGMNDVPPAWYLDPAVARRLDADRLRRAAIEGQLVRSSLRSMLVTSTYAELPAGNRTDPRVQARLHEITHEADFAALGVLAQLESIRPEEFRAFDDELRQNPDFIAEVVDLVDSEAAALDVPASRRRHLRATARHLAMELRRAPSATVVERTLQQVRRVIARHAKLEPALTFPDRNSPEAARWAALTDHAVALYQPEAVAREEADPMQSEPAAPSAAGLSPAPASRPVVSENCDCHPNDHQCIAVNGCHLPATTWKGRLVTSADARYRRKVGGALIGVGVVLIIPGAVFIPWTLGISGIAVTAGVILLIIGIVFMVRAKRQLAAMGM